MAENLRETERGECFKTPEAINSYMMSTEGFPRIWRHAGHRWPWQLIFHGMVVVQIRLRWLLAYPLSFAFFFVSSIFLLCPTTKWWDTSQLSLSFHLFIFFLLMLLFPMGLNVILCGCCPRFIFPAQVSLSAFHIHISNCSPDISSWIFPISRSVPHLLCFLPSAQLSLFQFTGPPFTQLLQLETKVSLLIPHVLSFRF